VSATAARHLLCKCHPPSPPAPALATTAPGSHHAPNPSATYELQRGEEVACLLIEKPAASCTAAATCQFFNRSSTARIRLGRD